MQSRIYWSRTVAVAVVVALGGRRHSADRPPRRSRAFPVAPRSPPLSPSRLHASPVSPVCCRAQSCGGSPSRAAPRLLLAVAPRLAPRSTVVPRLASPVASLPPPSPSGSVALEGRRRAVPLASSRTQACAGPKMSEFVRSSVRLDSPRTW